MKKINTIKLLLIIFTLSIFTQSCKKDNIEPNINNNTNISAQDLNVYNKIMSFKNKIKEVKNNQSLSTKSAMQPLDLDSTIWYLEAASNFTFADAGIKYNDYKVDSAFIIVPNKNGLVDWVELTNAYYAISDSLNVMYNNIQEESKQLILMDVSSNGVNANNFIFKIMCVFTKTKITTKSTASFGFFDWWMWGEEKGKCNGYTGTGDASNQIEYKANQTIIAPVNSYATDIETRTTCAGAVPRPSPVTTNYGSSDCYLYYETFNDPNYQGACFSPKDMDLFYDGLLHIEALFRPAGKVVQHYFLGDYESGLGGYYDHYSKITYCIWHTNPTGGGGQ